MPAGIGADQLESALADLSGAWIDRVHRRRPPDGIILDMDSFCHWAVEGNGFLCWAGEGSGSVASTGRHAFVIRAGEVT